MSSVFCKQSSHGSTLLTTLQYRSASAPLRDLCSKQTYIFREMASESQKPQMVEKRNFHRPHKHLATVFGVIPLEFHQDHMHQKTRFRRLSRGIICMMTRLAVLKEHQSVTDGQTDRHILYLRNTALCG